MDTTKKPEERKQPGANSGNGDSSQIARRHRQHPQVSVRHPLWGYRPIRIDRGIVPLLEALWDVGIYTANSCQDSPCGMVWIEFMDQYDAEQFLTIVAGIGTTGFDAEAELYPRMRVDIECENPTRPCWQYALWPQDHGFDCDDAETIHTGKPFVRLYPSVRFPRADYDCVLCLLRHHNQRLQAAAGACATVNAGGAQ
jgi:hypothetical protein